jgi:predicted DNA binding CopG/RHH family protein
MRKNIKYTDEPLGRVRKVKDFLPSPEALAFREDTVKVTMALSKTSVAFFKEKARRYKTPYQKMIRRLVDEYVKSNA